MYDVLEISMQMFSSFCELIKYVNVLKEFPLPCVTPMIMRFLNPPHVDDLCIYSVRQNQTGYFIPIYHPAILFYLEG